MRLNNELRIDIDTETKREILSNKPEEFSKSGYYRKLLLIGFHTYKFQLMKGNNILTPKLKEVK